MAVALVNLFWEKVSAWIEQYVRNLGVLVGILVAMGGGIGFGEKIRSFF